MGLLLAVIEEGRRCAVELLASRPMMSVAEPHLARVAWCVSLRISAPRFGLTSLYYPSRRQPTPAFVIRVKALRY